MKYKTLIYRFTAIICFSLLCVYSNGQERVTISDIKGIWVSTMLCVNGKEYIPIPKDGNVVSFGFTESKGRLNQSRYTGLYRVINESNNPKLIYYSLEGNKVLLYDSSDNPLSYHLEIESVLPKVSMTATIVDAANNVSVKMQFLYYINRKK